MSTIQNTSLPAAYAVREHKANLFTRFINWCASQEEYRFGWLAAILVAHGCALTPITLFAVILAGAKLSYFIIAILAMGLSLVTNLAAQPTKVTIPAFVFSLLVDVVLITLCLLHGFSLPG